MDHRGNWIIRSITNNDKHEFGVSEAGNVWTDDHETKFFKEVDLKLPKVLKRYAGKVNEKSRLE
jgi:hypothetical protein